MKRIFDPNTERALKRTWKIAIAALVPVALAAIAAAVLLGLAVRSGSIAETDIVIWFRVGGFILTLALFVLAVLLQAEVLLGRLQAPVVRAAIPLMIFSLGLVFTGVQASTQFFSTAAEIIPILLLALAIEGRAFSLRVMNGSHWLLTEVMKLMSIGTMLILGAGEAFALMATNQAPPSPMLTGVVVGALGAGFSGVMIFGLLGLFHRTGTESGFQI